MIEYTDPRNIPNLELEIAKPDRTIIGTIPEAFGKNQVIKLGQINEINFTIPFMIEKNFMLQRNPNVHKLKSKYLVRATFDTQQEWYIVSNLKSTFNSDGKEFLNVSLFSLGIQLADKKIRTWPGVYVNGEYRKESLNAQQVLQDLLSVSTWGIDYIDSEYLTKYRAFDFTNINRLDAIYQVATTFNGILQWNTENKTISLVKQENVGTNKGFRVSYGKYLKSLNREEKSDEVITRLKVYGKDGLSINRVNPSGSDYLEDYSYFLYPFSRDVNKNTISSSDYMSDSLCHALLDYSALLESKKTEFDSLLSQKETLQSQRTTKENELFTLESELIQIQDSIDVKQSQGLDATLEKQQETTKKSEIATKEAEIADINTQIASIDSQIATLKTTTSMESNFTVAQIQELNNFIIEDTWEDTNYFDDKELYKDAKKVFDELNKPKSIIDIDIVNLFKLMEAKKDWNKVKIGDKFYIYYEKFGIDVESQIVELNISHDSYSIKLTIANTTDIERDEEKLSKIIYKSISTSSSINMNKYKWDNISNVSNEVSDLINNTWESAERAITAGVNESVEINRRGVTISDPSDPNKFIRMTHGAIGFTQDGGNTYKTAILPGKVVAEVVMGKLFTGNNLQIQNESGNYTIDGNGFTITSTDTNKRVLLDVDNGLKFQVKEGTVYTDKLYYDSVNNRITLKGELDADELKVKGISVLTTDKSMISGQYIDKITAGQITATSLSAISADLGTITAGSITGVSITGGSITSNTTINVGTNANIGDNLYLGSQVTDGVLKSVYFNGQANITGGGGFVGADIDINCDTLNIVAGNITGLPPARFG